jgi:hypothetical protein
MRSRFHGHDATERNGTEKIPGKEHNAFKYAASARERKMSA